jgi:hypothetical protein
LWTQSDIRIWGWSRDGKAAYSIAQRDGRAAWVNVFIVDLINNTIIWRDHIDDFDLPTPDNVYSAFFQDE